MSPARAPRIGRPLAALVVSALVARALVPAASATSTCHVPVESMPYMDRVFAHLDRTSAEDFAFQAWSEPGRPAPETLGVQRFDAVDTERFVAEVFDVDHRTESHARVLESRSVPDPRFHPPATLRYYQLIDLSVFGRLQIDSVFTDAGTCHGFRTVVWSQLGPETEALSPEKGIRNAYSEGAWLASPVAIGYANSSAPRPDDTNPVQAAALGAGAEFTAKSMIEANIRAMYTAGR